jgi:predicted GNAT family acetyltransferase
VRDNPGESRYELVLDEHVVGEILYRLARDHVVLLHTEVLPSLENKGLGAPRTAG